MSNMPTILSVLEHDIVEQYMLGKSKREIAEGLGVAAPVVTKLLARKDVVDYLTEAHKDLEYARKDKMLAVMGRIVDDRLKAIEEDTENESGLARASRKDTVDILLAMDSIQKEKEKQELGTNKGNVYVQLVQNLMD